MIPILYEKTETDFASNGIGRLRDATRCEIVEERNGKYELVMEYPVGGALLEEVSYGRYIYALHDDSGEPQPFMVYKVSEPLKGVVTINAWHISYELNGVVVKPFSAGSCSAALAAIPGNSLNANRYTFWTDKSVAGNFSLKIPKSVRALLGGSEGSILDAYGTGEYEFDRFTVKLHLHRGSDRGVTIRYGKNLTKLDRALDGSNIYNSVAPYWTNADGVTIYTPTVVTKQGETAERTVALDLSNEFESQPTVSELTAKAQAYINSSESYKIKENIEIDFVALGQTEEYKDVASLERVSLCDTVTVIYGKAGVKAKAQCIKTTYDCLRERYISVELGEPKTSLSQQILSDVADKVAAVAPSKNYIQAMIDKATDLISGGFGGYIKYNYLSDGTPSEMLVMDAPNESQAVNILKINKNGIGFSNDGGATYTSAWTIDGRFVADFITAGTLRGIQLIGNTISGGTITSEGSYPSGTVGRTTLTAGTLNSVGVNNGSGDHYEAVFEASNILMEWYDLSNPSDKWSVYLEAGYLELKHMVNGNVVAQQTLNPETAVLEEVTVNRDMELRGRFIVGNWIRECAASQQYQSAIGSVSASAADVWTDVPDLSLIAPVTGLYAICAEVDYNHTEPYAIAIITRGASSSYVDYSAITDRYGHAAGTTQRLKTSCVVPLNAGDVVTVQVRLHDAGYTDDVRLKMYLL